MKRARPGQEFIDRERQLPADPRPLGAGVRPGELDKVPLGTPAIDYDVRSTFDVRPINALDFTFSQSQNPTAISESGAFWLFTFTVPPGFVAVVRWYQFFAHSPTGSNTEVSNWQGSLQRQGVNFNFNDNVFLGPVSERMPVFMIVDENQTFGVRVVNETIDGAPSASLNIHGNLLVKTGRAYPLEIANPVGVVKASVLAPESLYTPPPPPQVITKEVVREVIREREPQQPLPAAPPPIEAPPFEVRWIKQTRPSEGSCNAGNGMWWTPSAVIRGGRSTRNLTLEELRKYEAWLTQRCPPPDSGGGGATFRVARNSPR